jgi:hypothetical protein
MRGDSVIDIGLLKTNGNKLRSGVASLNKGVCPEGDYVLKI